MTWTPGTPLVGRDARGRWTKLPAAPTFSSHVSGLLDATQAAAFEHTGAGGEPARSATHVGPCALASERAAPINRETRAEMDRAIDAYFPARNVPLRIVETLPRRTEPPLSAWQLIVSLLLLAALLIGAPCAFVWWVIR